MQPLTPPAAGPASAPPPAAGEVPAADLLAAALRIGDELLAAAVERPDGSLHWGRGAGREYEFTEDSGPFNGRTGEALLFAALHAATGEERFAAAAERTLLTLTRGLASDRYRADLADRVVFGLAGLGGILYTLVRVGGFLGRPEPLAAAERLGGEFTPERIDEDGKLDIIWGSAGAALGLLALHDAGVPEALPRARRCVRHLLESRIADPVSGLRAWRTLRSVPSSGFAHGASGFAHAALRVHERTGEGELLDAALEAFAFERTLYREDLGNWEDSREEPDPPGMWSWCHGAPGIALARLSALPALAAAEGREEAESEIALDLRQALRFTAGARVPKVDTICCGTFGRVDILLEAGLRLQNPSLGRQALRLAGERLRRAETEGFLLTPVDEIADPLRPGFWQGLGGTAYTLLRLTDPERFPCLLAMA